MNLLIADDSALIRTRLAALIAELAGVHLVGQACNAPETLAAIQGLNPDVVLLDINMPGGGGLCVLKRLQQAQLPPLIIVLTAYTSPEYQEMCLKLGAAYFFDKAADIELLLDLLQQLQEREALGSG